MQPAQLNVPDWIHWNVKVKGGHAERDVVDVFFDGKQLIELSAERIETPNTHGSGCVFSAAITAGIALGMEPLEAIRRAKKFITQAIANSIEIGHGHGPVNPWSGQT